MRLTRFGVINCFLVQEDDGLTLVDTGLAGTAPGIVEAARRFGAPIRRIALTHAHLDHAGAVDSLVRLFPGIVLAVGLRESRLLDRDFSLAILLEPGSLSRKRTKAPKSEARASRCRPRKDDRISTCSHG